MKENIKAAIYIRLSKCEQAVLKKKNSKEKEVEKNYVIECGNKIIEENKNELTISHLMNKKFIKI